jgi:hypothetical protein
MRATVHPICHISGRLFHPPFYKDGDIPLVYFPLIETLPDGREVWHEVYTTKHRIQMVYDLRLGSDRIEIVRIVQGRARAFPERKRDGNVIYLLRVIDNS